MREWRKTGWEDGGILGRRTAECWIGGQKNIIYNQEDDGTYCTCVGQVAGGGQVTLLE